MSTIIASNISDGTTSVASTYVVNGSAKAWVNFNGTGTVAIRGSMNVGSITDVGTGDYNINFASAMQDTSYAAVATCEYRTTMQTDSPTFARTTSAVNVTAAVGASGSSLVGHQDKSIISVAIFR
tara:strand:- start:6 stop:380 length:375 start_codon:yes stop_codon:yes gene_type:complete